MKIFHVKFQSVKNRIMDEHKDSSALVEAWEGKLCHKGSTLATVRIFSGVELPVKM